MKTKLKQWLLFAVAFGSILRVHSQGYIVQNGVITNYSGAFLPGEISVLYNPNNLYYTGFALEPTGKTQPTFYTNTFSFDYIVDVGVRVFLVSSNDPISLQPILSQSYIELLNAPIQVFANGVPFYLALYTGNMTYAPPNGIYTDPLFGWVKLVNNQGVIQMLDSALEYQGGGIFAGTQNIIPVPEPSQLALGALGALLLGFRRRRRFMQKAADFIL